MDVGFIQLVHEHHDDGQLRQYLEGQNAPGDDVVLKSRSWSGQSKSQCIIAVLKTGMEWSNK